MIEVKVYWAAETIHGFSVTGHSDHSHHGSDIVCSAVSALAQTAVLALKSVADITPHWIRQEGLLECTIPSELSQDSIEKANIVLRTIVTGIENISQNYPRYVIVSSKEV